ncbi:MAG TPA: 8-amino-7-oxononanoate synthase, partial [Flavobacteriaceae bacterium]|nr:8-amino-7-oxononanoate synthase [Flavobacteriaceae bacterium]
KEMREEYGIFVSVVVYPVIPKGMIIFRIIPTAAHEDEHIEYTLNSFAEIKDKLADGYYKRKAEELNVDFVQY